MKNTLHIWICLVALLLTVTAPAKKPDSAFDSKVWEREKELLKEAGNASLAQSAQIYFRLASLFRDNEREIEYLSLAEENARQAKDMHLVGSAKLALLEHYSRFNDTNLFMNQAEDVCSFMQNHDDVRLANAQYLIIKRHIDEGRTQTALTIAEDMLKKADDDFDKYSQGYAYLSIGLIYSSVNQYFEAIKAYEDAIAAMDSYTAGFPELDRIIVGLELLGAQSNVGRYNESISTCRKTDALLEKYMDENSQLDEDILNRQSMRLYIQSYMAEDYIALKQLENAKIHLEKAESYIYPAIGLDIESYYLAKAKYHRAMGEYAQALEACEHSILAFKENNLLPYYLNALELKTKILADKGEWEKAYSCLSELEHAEDSLDARSFSTRISELHTIYEVDKIEYQKKRQQTMMLFSVLLCVLLALTVTAYIIYSNRLRHKNRSLYEQINTSMKNETKSAKVLQLASEDSLSREMSLFRKIAALMEEEHPFTDSDFGRSTLVRITCSNDKYVADAIREGAGVTVATYISDLRLNYSLWLLSNDEHLSLDDVARQSGFGSYSSFFRAFQKKYSITPSEYREYAKKDINIKY
ncbi:MAG: helix-turn-helix domain-containing protein [Candidatus Cryptobacteroides sp.]